MTIFWIGMAVFLVGLILRFVFKFQYYKAYKNEGNTELQRQELHGRYRRRLYVALVVQAVGCIMALIGAWS